MKARIFFVAVLLACVAAFGQANMSGQIYVYPSLTYTRTNTLGSTLTESLGVMLNDTITYGTNPAVGGPQMNALVRFNASLTNRQYVMLDLSTITNSFGEIKDFRKVGFLAVKTATNATISIGPAEDFPLGNPFGSYSDRVIIQPGGVYFVYSQEGFPVLATNRAITLSNMTAEVDGVYSQAGLGIDAVTTKIKTTNTVKYSIGGTNTYTKTATTNLAFTSADTINTETNAYDCYGAWRIQINSAGTISTKAPSTNQIFSSYTNALLAVPAVDSDNVSLGAVIVLSPTSTTFIAGTTELTTNNATFIEAATNPPTTAAFGLVVGGVASNLVESESDREVLRM